MTVSLLTKRAIAQKIVSLYFKNSEGNPFILTESQADIFNLIFLQEYPRNQVLTATQYGKTTTIALALIITTQTLKQDFVILAGTKEKAQLIMNAVIEHIFDNKDILSQLEYDESEKLSKIKHRKSRDYITWKKGGSIRILSANTGNTKAIKDSLTGHGEKRIIAEEASLIPDEVWGMVMRMLGGIENTFLLKIGNAVYRNHFYRSSKNPKYKNILVDWKKAVEEGRYSKEYIEEMREEMDEDLFKNFYDCVFPERESIDADGFRFLLKESDLNFVKKAEIKNGKLGGDVGEGNDESVFCLRNKKIAGIIEKNKIKDTMQQVPIIRNMLKNNNIDEIYLDAVGVGVGLVDRCEELGLSVTGIKWGNSSQEKEKFANLKAENFWKLREWIKTGGVIVEDKKLIQELLEIKYKIRSDKQIIIEPKENLKKRIKRSPDRADSLALTFNDRPFVGFV